MKNIPDPDDPLHKISFPLKEEYERAERLAPLVAAYIVAKHGPCSTPEICDALKDIDPSFSRLHTTVRDAIAQLLKKGDIQQLDHSKDLLDALPPPDVHEVVRLTLKTLLEKRASSALVAAGEKLLLCERYSSVVEIIDLLEELDNPTVAQKLRETMVRHGSIRPEEVLPY